MRMTREGTVAYSTPVLTGLRGTLAAQSACQHEFNDCGSGEPVGEHLALTLVLQQCGCGAARTKLTGPEVDLKKALGET